MAALEEKWTQRYRRFQQAHIQHFGERATGKLLDFGCGAGGFLIAALRDKVDARGIEVDEQRRKEFFRNAEQYAPNAKSRFTLYSGRLMPYPSNEFDSCFSWFVFEHVTDPQTSLREIVRVLKPYGTLTIHADDVRNAWDGHAQAPWPPYLPREFAAAYLDGLGLSGHENFITNYVVYISAPMIVDILTTLGMEIVYANSKPKRYPLLDGIYVTSDEEARQLGERVRSGGKIDSPAENLTIFARKTVLHEDTCAL